MYVSLLCEDTVENIPQFLFCYLINFDSRLMLDS